MKPISDHSFQLIIQSTETFIILSSHLKNLFRTKLFEIEIKKGTEILKLNEKQQYGWFLLNGLAREVRKHEKTEILITAWFWTPLSYIFTSPGFFSRDPSESIIEALKDCTIVILNYNDWYALKESHKELEILTEKIRAENDKLRLQHLEDITQLSTEERFLKHQTTLHLLFSHTKLKYIAEFMCMSSDTLGKLRRRL